MRKLIFLVILSFFSIFVSAQSKKNIDSCNYFKLKCDTLLHKNYVLNKKLVKLTFYEDIVIKKPTQLKFLKGWQLRTLKAQ